MNKEIQKQLKLLPAVDSVLKLDSSVKLIDEYGRSSFVTAVRKAVISMRDDIISTTTIDISVDEALIRTESILAAGVSCELKRVVNATGIILHTGLGRAVLPNAARTAITDLTGNCNIQMDLDTGERIKREQCIQKLIQDLTGAEDAVLVNNNAGATMLVLKALAEDKEVIVSRGELIEIGGSFRLPEIMEQSGAILHEVGATNKTHVKDYKKAVNENTALLLKVHKSNFDIVGFSKETTIHEIIQVGIDSNVPVIDDLGCGALVNLEDFGLEHEMTVRESIEAGSDVVLFSTDKLIGGPQGGLIVGKRELLDKVRAHPLYRALRVGKMTLAALETTLRLFKNPELLTSQHHLYNVIARSSDDLKKQAEEIVGKLSKLESNLDISITDEPSRLGGGSLPGTEIPSVAIQIKSPSIPTDDFIRRLRTSPIPVVAYIKNDAVLLNMRTVLPGEVSEIINAIELSIQ